MFITTNKFLCLTNLMLINLFYVLIIFILSLFIIILSKNGYLGKNLKKYCNSKSTTQFILLLIIFSGLITLITDLTLLVIHFNDLDLGYSVIYSNVIDNASGVQNTSLAGDTQQAQRVLQDPVRWWPSGLTKTWVIIGTAAAVYILSPGNFRAKVVATLATFGVSVPAMIVALAIENPYGFNLLMFSWIQYNKTGNWPTVHKTESITDKLIDEKIAKIPELSEAFKKSIGGNSGNTFLPTDVNKYIDSLFPEKIIQYLLKIFRPVEVEGHLDDLIGQQLFIMFLLLIIVISLIIFFLLYVFWNTIYNNREYFLNKYNNKYIKFYIKYQIFLTKISLIIIPLFILFGLIELLFGLHFLLTHPIPYENLGIDLHTFIKK